ncbi:unnamed protein product [Paramecium octaurelia]|uniref:Uncharacterized protein n=1 Tax=Paramecium octaurelia TaxID=43137 RepID=A0A8S1T7U9_PAROT|nr:unnamed protein product [Paramecium octaurelia]
MLNKVQTKQVTQESQKLQTIPEAMQNLNVRFSVSGSHYQTKSILALVCELVLCENDIELVYQCLLELQKLIMMAMLLWINIKNKIQSNKLYYTNLWDYSLNNQRQTRLQ